MKYFLYRLEHIYTDKSHIDYKLLGFCNDMDSLEKMRERH
jgi:hypothetical protein